MLAARVAGKEGGRMTNVRRGVKDVADPRRMVIVGGVNTGLEWTKCQLFSRILLNSVGASAITKLLRSTTEFRIST